MRMQRYKMTAFFVFFMIGTISLSAQRTCAAMIGCSNDEEAPNLFQINTTNGSSTIIGALPESMTECVYDPIKQKLYAQASDGSFTLYTINPATGASLGSVSTEAAFNGMAFVGNTLYATAITHGGGNSDLVTVNPVTGELTAIGPTGFGPIPGLAYNATTHTLYGVTNTSPALLITIGLSNGAGTVVGSTRLNKIGSIRFDGSGVLYGGLTGNAATDPDYLVRINTATGVAAAVGDTGNSITGLAWLPIGPSKAVPTMTGWGMILSMVLFLLGSVHHLRRRGRGQR